MASEPTDKVLRNSKIAHFRHKNTTTKNYSNKNVYDYDDVEEKSSKL